MSYARSSVNFTCKGKLRLPMLSGPFVLQNSHFGSNFQCFLGFDDGDRRAVVGLGLHISLDTAADIELGSWSQSWRVEFRTSTALADDLPGAGRPV